MGGTNSGFANVCVPPVGIGKVWFVEWHTPGVVSALDPTVEDKPQCLGIRGHVWLVHRQRCSCSQLARQPPRIAEVPSLSGDVTPLSGSTLNCSSKCSAGVVSFSFSFFAYEEDRSEVLKRFGWSSPRLRV